MQITRKYNLDLTVTNTSGLLASTYKDAKLSGTISLEGNEQFFTSYKGDIVVSGIIDTKNGEPMSPNISFNKAITLNSNQISYQMYNDQGKLQLNAIINDTISPHAIQNIVIMVSKRVAFMTQSLTLEGSATAIP